MCNHVQHNNAYHVQHVVCHVVRRDSSAIVFDRVEITFILDLFYWMKLLTDEGGGNQSIRRKPLTTSLRKCHLLNPDNSSPNRDSNLHWWQARKAHVLTITPREYKVKIVKRNKRRDINRKLDTCLVIGILSWRQSLY